MQNSENMFQRHGCNFLFATTKSHFELRSLSKPARQLKLTRWAKVCLERNREHRQSRRMSTSDWARYPLPLAALPNVPSRVLIVLSFLHDTHDLFYYFYFSLIILLNGLFRCSVKLLKFPFQELLALTATFQYWWMFGLDYW